MASKILSQKPRYYRGTVAKGLAKKSEPPIDPQGGDFGAGIIRGFAVITRGEALGHGVWIDQDFLQATADAINAKAEGIKARFTHPGLSGDGLGKHLGRVKNAVVDGDVVRADLHFAQAAHETPDGDLAAYVMKLAKEDPASFGASIVYAYDSEAEEAFIEANGGDRFQSPDPNNLENYPHARLAELRAVDAVDDPAANPEGMFHRGDEIASEANSLMAYALGLTADRPATKAFDIEPDRVLGFAQRFLDQHGLQIVPRTLEAETMPAETEGQAADEQKTEDEVTNPEASEATESADTSTEQTEGSSEASGEIANAVGPGQKFIDAFGEKGGLWFAQGKTFEQAQQLYSADLKATNDKLAADNELLKKQLAAAPRGEAEPVSFQAEGKQDQETIDKFSNTLAPGLATYAASLKVSRN